MLKVAEEKLRVCNQAVKQSLKLVNADMRSFDLAKKGFDFAFMAFNTFLHLLTNEEQLSCLSHIREHLRLRGGLAISVFQLEPRRPESVLRLSRAVKDFQSGAALVRYDQQSMDYAKQIMDVHYVYEINEKRIGCTFVTSYQLRILLRGELELLLYKAGFDEISIFGSFEKEPHGTL
jgi:hypothetical protein